MEFEWDLAKEEANIKKHGHSFSEAVECFKDPKGIQLMDAAHSVAEMRHFWVGKKASGKILTVWFTQRGAKIRIIGCAHWRKFRRFYEAAQIK
jgi:uncharacterized DUF497 family protein